ncbi:MAG: hypothetical protein ACOVT5_00565, partial [Armatimonadaceae bacterium]
KYNDRNGDGIQGAGEEALAGFQFSVTVTDVTGKTINSFPTVPITDANGEVLVETEPLFLVRYPWTWTVREIGTDLSWTQTEPNATSAGAVYKDGQWCWTKIDLVGGGVDILQFGNAQMGMLSGLKFHDKDASGSRDAGTEPGLPGFTIQIVATLPDGMTQTQTATTGADGRWSAGPFPYGTTWTAAEQTPPDPWRQTAPAGGGGYSGTVDGDLDGLDFGNARYLPLRGIKYHDRNGNGSREPGEPPLPGWTFNVAVGGGPTFSIVSGMDGTWVTDEAYREGLAAQVYEESREGWQQTEPPATEIWLGTIGEGVVVHFGNARWLPITGVKYHDRNANGNREPSEPGLSGFAFRAVVDDPRGFTLVMDAVSGADGTWDFPQKVLEGSAYTIEERLDSTPGWAQSEPDNNEPYTGVIQEALSVRFGNFEAIKLTGRKYYDCDLNGVISPPDALTSGLGGIRIVVTVWRGKAKLATENILTSEDGTW